MAAQTTGLLGLLNIQLASQRCDVVLAPREGCLNVGGRRVMSFVVSRSNMMLGRCRIVWKQNLAVPKAAVPGRRHVWVAGEDSKHLKPIRPSSPSRSPRGVESDGHRSLESDGTCHPMTGSLGGPLERTLPSLPCPSSRFHSSGLFKGFGTSHDGRRTSGPPPAWCFVRPRRTSDRGRR